MKSARTQHDPSPDGEGNYLQALLADFESLRSDFIRLDQNGAALLALAVTIMTAIVAFLSQTCTLPQMVCTPHMWQPLYAFIPAIPSALILLFADLGNAKTLRMYYTRAVEAELRRLGNAPDVTFAGGSSVKLPGYGQISVGLLGQHRGRMRYRFTLMFIYVLVTILYLTTTGLSLWIARPIDLQLLMGLIYVACVTLALRITWLGGAGSRTLWKEATNPASRAHDSALSRMPPTMTSASRSIWRYLILPRPHELFARFWIIPAAWLAVAGSDISTDSIALGRFVIVIGLTLFFELVIYQARYIINDIRSIDTDATYSSYKKSNRFPYPAIAAWIRYGILTVALRVALGLWVALRLLPPHDGLIFAVAMGVLAIQSAVYESLRATISKQVGCGVTRLTQGRVLIYLIVAIGYAIRAWVGFALGGVGPEAIPLGILLSVMAISFGSMAVTMAWALSAICQVAPPSDKTWPSTKYYRTLLNYTHLGPLAYQAKILADSRAVGVLDADPPPESNALRTWRALEPVSSATWWNLSFIIFAATASTAAVVLYGTPDAWHLVLVASVGTLMAVLVVRAYSAMALLWIAKVPLHRGIVGVVIATFAVFLASLLGSSYLSGIAAACGFLFAAMNYLYCRHASTADMEVTFRDIRQKLTRSLQPAYWRFMRCVVGSAATSLLQRRTKQ